MTAPSQEVQAKAGQYLLQHRVHIDYADQRAFAGLVQGSSTVPYQVTCVDGRWRCDCPATAACSHIVACQAVWTPPVPAYEGDPFDLIPGA